MTEAVLPTFIKRHHNRLEFPTKHILVAEDDIVHQIELLVHLSHMYTRQGQVRLTAVSGGASAAGVISSETVDLIILDFDMPYGNAEDLINWMKHHDCKVPIITASGWEPNLAVMQQLLNGSEIRHWIHSKEQVIKGTADYAIREVIGEVK